MITMMAIRNFYVKVTMRILPALQAAKPLSHWPAGTCQIVKVGVFPNLVFMLDNKLYLHPSLSSNGDHEDKPDHLDHLGNGKAWKQWGSLVYLHAGLSR